MQIFKQTVLIFLVLAVILLVVTGFRLLTHRGNMRTNGIYLFLAVIITLSFSCLYFLVLRLYQ